MLELDFFRHFLLSRRAGSVIRIVAWLAMIGVAIGVTALIVVVSVMSGFHESIRKKLLAVEPHIVIEVPRAMAEYSAELSGILTREQALVHRIERQDIVVRTADGVFSGAEARGLSSDGVLKLLSGIEQANQGETSPEYELAPIDAGEMSMRPGEVMLGADLARSLGVYEGDKLTVMAPEALLLPPGEVPRFERVIVKRLLRTNVSEIDAKLFMYSQGQALRSLGDSVARRSEFEIWLGDPDRAEAVASELRATLRNQDGEVKILTWGDRNSALFMALRLEIVSIGLFLSLSTMIAGFSIITVLLILITQKRKEIGLLMSIGLSRRRTRQLFTRLGVCLSGAGITVGAIAGVVLCRLIASNKASILPEFYWDTTVPAKISPVFVITVLLLAYALSYLASFLPARKITDLEPADALMSRHRNREELRSAKS